MNRILGVLSVATLLVACGGSSPVKHPDLGGTVDLSGGGADLTITKKDDGEACTSKAQCAGGVCDTTKVTGGYCTHDCSTGDGTCPGNGVAVSFSDGTCSCLSACSKAGDCRTGLYCAVLSDGMTGVCDGPDATGCDPTTGTGDCTTDTGYIWTGGIPGACTPSQQVFDTAGKAQWQGLCTPTCVPGGNTCDFKTQDGVYGGQCGLDDFTKQADATTHVAYGFKYKGPDCEFVQLSTATVAAGSACPGGTAAAPTSCVPGATCDPTKTTGQTCETLCTYKAAGDAGAAVACASGTCTDVLSLGASAVNPVGVCK